MNGIKWGVYLREPSWSTDQLHDYISKLDTDFSFYGLFTNDHLTGFDKSVNGKENYLEAWTFITSVLMWSKRLHAGHTVLCQSFRNPALLAKQVSTLDNLSKGRFDLFLGAGWKEDEYEAYSYPFPSPGERLKQLEEQVTILRNMFDPDIGTWNFSGKYWTLKEARNFPKPYTKNLPIHLGGSKPRFIKLAARIADGFNTGSDYKTALDRFSKFDDEVRNLGEDSSKRVKSYFGGLRIFSSNEEAITFAKEQIQKNDNFKDKTPQELVKNQMWGDPEALADKIRNLVAIGTSFFIFKYISSYGNPLEVFWDEVRPLI
ncbi:MAG: LLM class flavin-dependent oxidoreductase [Candidatus Hodarchaeales archaeon]|jgi:alkanesulfonate monooxygenase SsuD/methylene tetrahydromethanopterin reductase-like flavin-dependent oxidoreductase (luciferase family)